MTVIPEENHKEQTIRIDRFVQIVLAVAMVLRVAIMVTVFTTTETHSGDGWFYIKNAQQPWRLGIVQPTEEDPLRWQAATTSIGPAYPLFLIPFFALIPDSAEIAQIMGGRLAQAALDTIAILLLYLMTLHLFDRRVARVVLVFQAMDLRYIYTVGTIATETLFITLFLGFMFFYLRGSVRADSEQASPGRLFGTAGLLLGAAILTRPVPQLYPIVLLAHAWLAPRAPTRFVERRKMMMGLGRLVLAAALLVVPWMVRTMIASRDFTPISDSVWVHFFRSTQEEGDDLSSDDSLAEAEMEEIGRTNSDGENPHVEGGEYLSAGLRSIGEAPLQWLKRVATDTLGSYLQPFGTVITTPRGAGIKEMALAFLQGQVPLRDVVGLPGFWRRLLMYIWHYWGLVGGITGMALLIRRRWWQMIPLVGWVVYVTAVMATLLVEPRYLFPTMFVFTMFAAYATVEGWDTLRRWGTTRIPSG